MTAILTAGPLIEPVSLAEVKAHLRVDSADEDTMINNLITAARLHIEAHLSLALLQQSWSVFLDDWPAKPCVDIPLAPLVSIDLVNIYDKAGMALVLDASNYYADVVGRVPRLVKSHDGVWSKPGRRTSGVEIQITVGYGLAANDVPQTLRQSIMALVAHWFENRELVSLSGNPIVVPNTVAVMLHPFRRLRTY